VFWLFCVCFGKTFFLVKYHQNCDLFPLLNCEESQLSPSSISKTKITKTLIRRSPQNQN